MHASQPRTHLMPAHCLALSLALSLVMGLPAARAQTQDSLIKPLLAAKVGDAVCFTGTFDGPKVDISDYEKSKLVPVPGLFRFGEPVMRPQPQVHAGQQLKAMTLVLSHDGRQHQDWDEMHDFYLEIALDGWRDTLQAVGECPLRLTHRPIQGARDPDEVDTTTLACGIDCDGGLMVVERVAGTGDVVFRLDPRVTGLRMSEGCSGRSGLYVSDTGRERDGPEHEPTSFRLRPMPAAQCTAYRQEIGR
jgi:hypothetical protein